MAKIPVSKYPNQAGYLQFDTDTNQLEVFSDGTFKDILSGLGVATEDYNGLMTKEDKTKLNKIGIENNVLITVGNGGDFATLNEALKEASKYYPLYVNGGVTVEIRLLAGFVLDEPTIHIENLDLRYVVITGEDPITTVNYTGFTGGTSEADAYVNFLVKNAFLPTFKQSFQTTETAYTMFVRGLGNVSVSAIGNEDVAFADAADEDFIKFNGFYHVFNLYGPQNSIMLINISCQNTETLIAGGNIALSVNGMKSTSTPSGHFLSVHHTRGSIKSGNIDGDLAISSLSSITFRNINFNDKTIYVYYGAMIYSYNNTNVSYNIATNTLTPNGIIFI